MSAASEPAWPPPGESLPEFRGTIAVWSSDVGSGIITSPATPGGCWFDLSALVPAGSLEGFQPTRLADLGVGLAVEFTFEPAGQDGLVDRALTIRIV